MSMRSSDLYLHALCLAAYAPGEPTTKIAKVVVNMFDEFSKEERAIMSPINLLYVKLLRQIAEGTLDLSNRSEVSSVLLQYQEDPAFKTNKYSFDELTSLLMPEQLPPPAKIKMLFNKIKGNIAFYKGTRRIRKMMLTAQRAGSEDDIEKQQALFKDILLSAESLRMDIEDDPSGEMDTAPVDEIDMSNPDSIMKALKQQHKKRNGTGIRFGLQGFNRMWGKTRTAAYGEVMSVAARSHHYKSGMLMDMTRWHCVYNKPPEVGKCVPVILFISLENEVSENLINWYKALFCNAFHKEPDGFTDEEVVTYVQREMSKNGFKLLVLRRMGEVFGYNEYVQIVENLEKTGCKVVATYLDYATLCRRCPEDRDKNDPKQIQLMIARFKDFAAHREMFFATGLQLDTEAARIAQSGQTNIVKRYNESVLADCKSVKKELDVLIFLEIENNHKGIPYLTCKLDKHRYVHDTPPDDKYCAYRFTKLGLMDDISGADESVKDIFADEPDDASEGATIAVF